MLFDVGLAMREKCWDKAQSARHFKDDDEEKYMVNERNEQKKQAAAPPQDTGANGWGR